MSDEKIDDDKDKKEDQDPDEALKKVLAKNEELLSEAKAAKAKVREFEAAEAERKAEAAKREEEEARKKGDFENLLKSETKKVEEKEGEALLWKSKYFDRELDLGLTRAVDEINVKPELPKAAMALLRADADIDEDGKITLGDKPIADAIKEWAKSEDGKAFILNGSAGGGANGGGNGNKGDKNPWAKESFNLTEQGRIYKTNKAQAIEMAAAHGIKLN